MVKISLQGRSFKKIINELILPAKDVAITLNLIQTKFIKRRQTQTSLR